MLEKDKFLEKTKYIIFVIVIFFSQNITAETTKSKILKYNNNLKNSSASFIQSDGKTIEEGVIYFGVDRIKINYTKPEKLTVILSENKGIYTNHELRESEFFNTNKSYIKVFFKILNGGNFSEKMEVYKNFVEIKDNFNLNDNIYKIKIVYESDPTILRKIVILENNHNLELGFFNHNDLEIFEKKFF